MKKSSEEQAAQNNAAVSNSNENLEMDKRYRVYGKRYRVYGKRNNNHGLEEIYNDNQVDDEENGKADDNEDDLNDEMHKRYRVYGKRVIDDLLEELNKRYRVYGKRYRVYGK